MQSQLYPQYQIYQSILLLCTKCNKSTKLTQIMIQQCKWKGYCIECSNSICERLRYLPQLLYEINRRNSTNRFEFNNKQDIRLIKQQCKKLIRRCNQKLIQFEKNINEYCNSLQQRIRGYDQKLYTHSQILKKIQINNNLNILKNYLNSQHQKKLLFNINLDFQILNLKSLLQQISTYHISLPNIQQKKKQIHKQSICKTQILSIISYQNRIFFGTAEGQIIYKTINHTIKIKAHQGILPSLAIYHDHLISGGNDRKIKIWKIQQHNLVQKAIFGDNLIKNTYHNNLVVLQKQDILISTSTKSNQHKIRMWCLKKLELIYQFEGHSDYVNSIVRIQFQNYFISASTDSTIRIWNFNQKKCSKIIYHHNKIILMRYTPKFNFIIIYDDKFYFTIYPLSLETSKTRSIASWKQKKPISNFILPYDQNIVCSGAGFINIYNFNGEMIKYICIDTIQINFMICLRDNIIGGDGIGNMMTVLLYKNLKSRKIC